MLYGPNLAHKFLRVIEIYPIKKKFIKLPSAILIKGSFLDFFHIILKEVIYP